MNFVGEEQVASIQFSDYLGDPTVAVLDVDFASSELDRFNVYVYNDGEFVGVLEDQSSGSVRISDVGTDFPWVGVVCGVEVSYVWGCPLEFPVPGAGDCQPRWHLPLSICADSSWEIDSGIESLTGDFIDLIPIDTSLDDNDYSGVTTEINAEGVSGITVDVAGSSPTVAIGQALSAPHYDEFGELLIAQVGVSFSSSAPDSDAIFKGEDVDGDGLADLVVDTFAQPVSLEMQLGGVNAAAIGIGIDTQVIPCLQFSPWWNRDGVVGPGCNLIFDPWPNPFGDDLFGVIPDFEGSGDGTYALELYSNGKLVFSQAGINGAAGGTDLLPIEIGVVNDAQQLGFSASYPTGAIFTALDGTLVSNWDEIRMSVAPLPADSQDTLAYIDIQASDMDSMDFFNPTTVIASLNECPADMNGDGVLNFFDVSAFLSAFAAQEPAADFTNDGVFNFFDVSAFLSAFAAGCP